MIRFLINAYILVVILDAVLSYFPGLKGQSWVQILRQIADFTQKPIRKVLPPDMPIDLSPLIVILGLQLLMALW